MVRLRRAGFLRVPGGFGVFREVQLAWPEWGFVNASEPMIILSQRVQFEINAAFSGATMKFRNSLAMSTFLASPRITTTLVNSFGKIPIVQRLPIAP